MKQVTKHEFFAAIGGLNVHPHSLPDRSDWETQDGSRRLVGRTYPGWRHRHGEAESYYLEDAFLPTQDFNEQEVR